MRFHRAAARRKFSSSARAIDCERVASLRRWGALLQTPFTSWVTPGVSSCHLHVKPDSGYRTGTSRFERFGGTEK